ncbi:peptidylprolyl isomerase [Candidatus Bathyarchaeota archaeon]|nr:peptidylprolyl isomerase [Candidatus Bathyarchaeota archaeon]
MSPGKSGRQKKFKHTHRKSSKLPLAIGLLIIITVVVAVVHVFSLDDDSGGSTSSGGTVLLQTSLGNITIQLRDDKPITTGNFKNLIEQGFYDGTIFHRVIADFVVQGGQNTDVTVDTIADEIGSDNHNYRGTVAMAKTSQPNSATSQFFINVANNNEIVYSDGTEFDETYTVFGTVTSGMDVVDAISSAETDSDCLPLTDIVLIKAEIIS